VIILIKLSESPFRKRGRAQLEDRICLFSRIEQNTGKTVNGTLIRMRSLATQKLLLATQQLKQELHMSLVLPEIGALTGDGGSAGSPYNPTRPAKGKPGYWTNT
jgi:hypothetical protein